MLLQPLWQQWTSDTATLATQLLTALDACLHTHAPQPPRPPPTNDPLLLTLERWLFVLKALRRVVLFGGVSDAKTMQPNEAVLQVGGCACVVHDRMCGWGGACTDHYNLCLCSTLHTHTHKQSSRLPLTCNGVPLVC